MGNKLSVCKKESLQECPQSSVKKTALRFIRDLDPTERYHLNMALFCLAINAATNMMFPRLIGSMMDSTYLGGSSSIDECPHQYFPIPLSPFREGYNRLVAATPNWFFVRMILFGLPLYACGCAASWFRVYHTQTAIYLIQKRCRRNVFRKMLAQNLLFFHSNTPAHLLSKLLQDCEEGPKVFVETFMQTLRSLNSTIGGTYHLLMISPLLTLYSLLTIPVVALAVCSFSARLKRFQKLKREKMDSVMEKAHEVVTAIEDVICFAREGREAEAFARSLDGCDEVSLLSNHLEGFRMAMALATFNLMSALVISAYSKLLRGENFTAGKFGSYVIYGGLLGLGVAGLTRMESKWLNATSAINSIYEITDVPDTEDEALVLDEVRGDLEVRNLAFEYPRRKGRVLEGISLKIEAGEVVAIVGPSGAGKTTLCKLLMTVYRPTEGEVLLDSTDAAHLSSRWIRDSVFSVVPQEPMLFSLTIEENMKYGSPNATREQVIQLSKDCNLHDFVDSLPLKYETRLGSGTCLSTGQKQRIALVRALLKKAPVLVLDEPTSSLDGFSEELVTTAIDLASVDRTLIIVTHRPEVLTRASKVAVLNGTLEYFGTLEEAKINSPTFKLIFPSI